MKTKVLMFANNGNDLIRPYKELNALSGVNGAYLYEIKSNYFGLVYEFDGLFAEVGAYYDNQIGREDFTERVRENYGSYIPSILASKWVNMVQIEIYKHLGLDTSQLFAIREAHIAARELADLLKKENEAEEAKKYAEEERNRMRECANEFISGKNIDKLDFLDLCDENGIVLPIRTKGMLNSLSYAKIGFNGANIFQQKGRKKDFGQVFKAAKELKEVLLLKTA